MVHRALALATLAGAMTMSSACSTEGAARSGASSVRRSAGATAALPDTTRVAAAGGGDSVRASIAGVGAVRFGTTLDVAARAAGGTAAHPPGGSCGFVSFRGLPRGVRFMVSYDTVVRADVDSATVATDAGARVGMSEDSVQRLYADHLRVTPHKYASGAHYLTLVPTTPADTLRRIVFETDGRRVTRYRAGLLPYVANVEGCG